MSRSKETSGKKDVRNKQLQKRKLKERRKAERKEQGSKSLDDMIAYVDENGVITSTPPDKTKKTEIDVESIEIGIPKAEHRINHRLKTGRLKSFDEMKGFGFIIDSQTKDSIFVHTNDCLEPIKIGGRLEYELEKGLKGLKAVNVKPIV